MKKALIFSFSLIFAMIISTNVFAEKFTYDQQGRLTSVIYENNQPNTTNKKVTYTYDEMGNITKVEIGPDGSDLQAPTAPTNLQKTSVATNSVALSWTASTDNVGVTGYDVYRNNVKIVTQLTTTYTDSGFTANKIHDYYVVAKDSAGNISVPSNTLTVLLDNVPPSTPTNLYSTPISQSSIYLDWNSSTDNFGVTGYSVYSNDNFLATIVGNSCNMLNIPANSLRKYRVNAIDAAGNISLSSNVVSIYNGIDVSTDKEPPSTPQDFRLKSSTATTATFGWSLSSDNLGVAGYEVYKNNTKIQTLSNTIQAYYISSMPANVSVNYYIKAIDFGGNLSTQTTTITLYNGVIIDNQAPSKPLNFEMTTSTATTAEFDWNDSTDNVAVAEYAVFVNNENIGTIPTSVCLISNLVENVVNEIYIEAIDSSGNYSEASETIRIFNGILVDDTEPNETLETATITNINTIIDATIHSSEDRDVYKINSSVNARWRITLVCPDDKDYDCPIYDANGNLLWAIESTAKSEFIDVDVGNQTYYLDMHGFNGACSDLPYTLTIEEIIE